MTEVAPSFNLHRIEQRRDRIYSEFLAPLIGLPVQGARFERLVRGIRRTLPGGVSPDAVFESVRQISGEPLTAVEGYQLAWRLAGNIDRLRRGDPVTPWTVQVEDEWVPLQVLRCTMTRNRRGRVGYDFSFRVMAGTPCPLRIRHFWKTNVVYHIASKIGFSKPWGKYPFQKSAQLVGLRLLARIEADRSRDLPDFYEIACPQALANWNRKHVLRLRFRLNGERCPNGWEHPCHRCSVGYEDCPAGTHQLSYETGHCVLCEDLEAVFDPEDKSPHCIRCTQKARLRRNS